MIKDSMCYICDNSLKMFEFDQYLGFLAFLTILTIGFWLFFVLLLFVIPYWVFGALKERIEEFIQERKKR